MAQCANPIQCRLLLSMDTCFQYEATAVIEFSLTSTSAARTRTDAYDWCICHDWCVCGCLGALAPGQRCTPTVVNCGSGLLLGGFLLGYLWFRWYVHWFRICSEWDVHKLCLWHENGLLATRWNAFLWVGWIVVDEWQLASRGLQE